MKGTVRILMALLSLLPCRGSYSGNSNSNNDEQAYDDDAYAQSYSVCDDSVVEVTSLTVVCNSAYTFYYGNGAHRNSQVCDYGDKATLQVDFTVNGDLDSGIDIYITMAVLTDNDVLAYTQSKTLCDNFVGSECTTSGSYTFTKKLKLGTGDSQNATEFVPTVQMAFSTASDGGNNLGAVNMECEDWNADNPGYAEWTDREAASLTPMESFLNSYAILIGTCILLTGFAGSIWISSYRGEDEVAYSMRNDDQREMNLMA